MKKNTKPLPKVNALINALQTNDTFTANGAVTHSTTSVALVDFFGKGGAMRSQPDSEVLSLFGSAYKEDKDIALKTLFYLADVREGQGERKLLRNCFKWLAVNDGKVAQKLITQIPEFTRWDNVLETLQDTNLEANALDLIASQLLVDNAEMLSGKAPSICAKWAPSEQASSKVTKALASKLRNHMGMTPRQYRKMISALRKEIDVVERKMCSNEWTDINYPGVPSRASTIYRKAFGRHDPAGYDKFLKKVEKGEVTINASVLYPYDLVKTYTGWTSEADRTIEAQWKALPNYADQEKNILVVADVSGSMDSMTGSVKAVDVAVSLAIYTAERNKGIFKDNFLIFSSDTKLITLRGTNLRDRVQEVLGQRDVANTNLQSVFDLILSKAVANKIKQADLPSSIILISDMQFDSACDGINNLDAIKEKYKQAGYQMPTIVFWNVKSSDNVPVKYNDKGVCLVSGCSPVILKTVIGGKVSNPYQMMIDTVVIERYKSIKA